MVGRRWQNGSAVVAAAPKPVYGASGVRDERTCWTHLLRTSNDACARARASANGRRWPADVTVEKTAAAATAVTAATAAGN